MSTGLEPGGTLPTRLRDMVRLLGKGPGERERARGLWPFPEGAGADRDRPVLAEGPHLVEEALSALVPVSAVIVQSDKDAAYASLLARAYDRGVPVFRVKRGAFESLAATRTPQGLLAVCGIRVAVGEDWRPKGAALALDGVQDPGNVGSILRTARAAGILHVALGVDTARPDDAKTVRASQGAVFTTDLWRGDLAAWCEGYRQGAPGGVRLVATRPREGMTPWQADLTGDVVLLLGGEGRGLDPALDRMAEVGVTVPMRSGESLGVAAACAALLFERVRQEETERA